MHSLSFLSSSSTLIPSLSVFNSSKPKKLTRLQSHYLSPKPKLLSFSTKQSDVSRHIAFSVSSSSPPEETVSMVDFHEKDWSFLESMETEQNQKLEKIIKAGEVTESSRVLVSISSEGFVDRLVESSPSQLLLIVHDSLFVLACVKEKYDKVKCWQGELIYVPEKWSPLDVVFLYFLPALPFGLDEVFKTLSQLCSSGNNVLTMSSFVLVWFLTQCGPDDSTLRSVAKKHSFELTQFVDEQGLYLAVLKFSKR